MRECCGRLEGEEVSGLALVLDCGRGVSLCVELTEFSELLRDRGAFAEIASFGRGEVNIEGDSGTGSDERRGTGLEYEASPEGEIEEGAPGDEEGGTPGDEAPPEGDGYWKGVCVASRDGGDRKACGEEKA